MNAYAYKEVLEAGKQSPQIILENPKPETVYMLIYTSGTTGDPKAATITHHNIIVLQHHFDYIESEC